MHRIVARSIEWSGREGKQNWQWAHVIEKRCKLSSNYLNFDVWNIAIIAVRIQNGPRLRYGVRSRVRRSHIEGIEDTEKSRWKELQFSQKMSMAGYVGSNHNS